MPTAGEKQSFFDDRPLTPKKKLNEAVRCGEDKAAGEGEGRGGAAGKSQFI